MNKAPTSTPHDAVLKHFCATLRQLGIFYKYIFPLRCAT